MITIKGITKGDTIRFQFTVKENITGWKLRAELYDDCGHSIKRANTASGGSDSQIIVDDVTNGIFTVIIPMDETTLFDEESHLEIEIVDSNNEKYTMLNGNDTVVDLKTQKIKWTTPND